MDDGDPSTWLVGVVAVGDLVTLGYRGGDVWGGGWLEPCLSEEDNVWGLADNDIPELGGVFA